MRHIGDIAHPQFKITLFHWNEKFLVKIEAGPYEQTYKIHETDITEEELRKNVNEEFLTDAKKVFELMHQNRSRLL